MTFTTFCRLLSQAVIHSRQPVALNWARNSFGLVLTVFLRKICILGIAKYFLIVLFQISEIKKDEIRFKKYIFLLDMSLIVGGRVPVTGMLAGMNLSKPGINLSKPGMNLSKPGKKHRNHVIITHNLQAAINFKKTRIKKNNKKVKAPIKLTNNWRKRLWIGLHHESATT